MFRGHTCQATALLESFHFSLIAELLFMLLHKANEFIKMSKMINANEFQVICFPLAVLFLRLFFVIKIT